MTMFLSAYAYDGNPLPVTGPRNGIGIIADEANKTYYGTEQNDVFRPSLNSTLVGGGGDDTYYVDASTTIIETAGGGIDTAIPFIDHYTLPAHVENLHLNRTNGYGIGNAGANLISGSAGRQTLDGAGGNDVLTGGQGSDIFVVTLGEGNDVITDFEVGIDHVRLNSFTGFSSFADIRSALSQSGADAVLDLGEGQSLIFRNRSRDDFTAKDFWLPIGTTTLTFADDFDNFSYSPDGSTGTWRTTFVNGDRTLSSNGEKQYYSDPSVGVNPFEVRDGVLTITASQGTNPADLPYNSGLITTAGSFSQLYGYFEMNAQLPAGFSLWSGFWMMTHNGWPPEIDVVEYLGRDPETLYMTYHTKQTGSHVAVPTTVRTDDLSLGFHTYGLDWGPDEISWYLDRNKIGSVATPADMHSPMYLLANLAVGGWGGQPSLSTPALAEMKIDYIHAYANAYTVLDPDLVGGDGDDFLVARSWTDSIDGGAGIDTVVLAGVSNDYEFTPNVTQPSAVSVMRKGVTKTILNTEFLSFENGIFSVKELVNRGPVAAGDYFAAQNDQPLLLKISDLLNNDIDPDNDMLSLLSIANGIGGTVSIEEDKIRFMPLVNFEGQAFFKYTISDGIGGTSSAVVSVTLAALPKFQSPHDASGTGWNELLDPSSRETSPQLTDGQVSNDILRGGAGLNQVDGGAGFDVLDAGLIGRRGVTFTLQGDGGVLFQRVDGSADVLRNVEVVQFVDGREVFDPNDTASVVTRLYEAALDRVPDQEGLNYWIDQLNGGRALTDLALQFAGGIEFTARFGSNSSLSNGQFVDRLYQNVLNRAGDAEGQAYWVGQLDAGRTREDVLANGFSEGVENRAGTAALIAGGIWDVSESAAFTARLYDSMYGRLPDQEGLNFWRIGLESGTFSRSSVVQSFLTTPETLARYGNVDTQPVSVLVDLLYQNTLGRPGEAEGRNYWIGEVESGRLGRTDLVIAFSEGVEHVRATQDEVRSEAPSQFGILFA